MTISQRRGRKRVVVVSGEGSWARPLLIIFAVLADNKSCGDNRQSLHVGVLSSERYGSCFEPRQCDDAMKVPHVDALGSLHAQSASQSHITCGGRYGVRYWRNTCVSHISRAVGGGHDRRPVSGEEDAVPTALQRPGATRWRVLDHDEFFLSESCSNGERQRGFEGKCASA